MTYNYLSGRDNSGSTTGLLRVTHGVTGMSDLGARKRNVPVLNQIGRI